MRVLTCVGARPQFIKAAVLSEELARRGIEEILVHTGQHYDTTMSEVFFDELRLPRPVHELGVGSAGHGVQTGMMMERLEPVVQGESPDWLLVYGDTNSTLAGALVGAKLRVPVAHIEAGLRAFNRNIPEEINRIVTDHVADLLLAPNDNALRQLRMEGIERGVVVVGDLMVDLALSAASALPLRPPILDRFGLRPQEYGVVTIHRACNTDDEGVFARLVEGIRKVEMPIVFPIHPRTQLLAEKNGVGKADNLIPCEPLSYLNVIALLSCSAILFTDSGGMQKEAYVLGIPCVTLREETEWVETLSGGWNTLTGDDPESIAVAARRAPTAPRAHPYGEGGAARAIVDALGATMRSSSRANAQARSRAVKTPHGNFTSWSPAT